MPPTGTRPCLLLALGALSSNPTAARYTVPSREWLSGSGGGRPENVAASRTPSAPSAPRGMNAHSRTTQRHVVTVFAIRQHARYRPNITFCDRESHRLVVARSFDTYASMLDNPTLNVELRPHEGCVVGRIGLAPCSRHCEHERRRCEHHSGTCVARSELLL